MTETMRAATGADEAAASEPRQRPRRRRYERLDTGTPARESGRAGSGAGVLTPRKIGLLVQLAEHRLLSLPQAASLEGLTPKAARKHLRVLFDAGLVRVVGVPRAALADADDPNDPTLLYGSAPNLYQPTKEALHLLWEAGKISRAERDRPVPEYGPKNHLFLAHEVQVRDIRVWLERCRRLGEGELLDWREGAEATFDLAGTGAGARFLRPDAWFAFRTRSGGVLVGLVEVDRGTERGAERWGEKLDHYGALFHQGRALLKATTGYEAGRVLVMAPTPARRDWLADFIAAEAGGDAFLRDRFWIAVRAEMAAAPRVSAALWRRAGDSHPRPLVESR